MTVFDASVVADALVVAGPVGRAARQALATADVLPAPEVLVTEVASALRGLVLGGHLGAGRATGAIAHLRTLAIDVYPTGVLLERAWELRANLTVYDACYAALAEELDTTLVTTDEGLLRAPGLGCAVVTPADFVGGLG